jgi:hypothetical protein
MKMFKMLTWLLVSLHFIAATSFSLGKVNLSNKSSMETGLSMATWSNGQAGTHRIFLS